MSFYDMKALAPDLPFAGRVNKQRAELDLLLAVFDSFPEAVLACDPQGFVLFMNRAAIKLYGDRRINHPLFDCAKEFGVYRPDGKTLLHMEELPLFRALRGELVKDEELFVKPPRSKGFHRVLATGNQLHDKEGSLMGAVVVTRRYVPSP